ncbi:AI-2E family transporter [Vibrio agarivorans]|uniref:AI-2E family transporter n=1 Tax=Vibrio agarivorans TaxID=153622 RepID=A0ABT7Y7I9_9VIBR|nr:AI-2E family transporter [Vibrio agarivorans]MDN2483709.1 AI-2E family transporter [Vibrio agarivorans]
MDIKDDFSKQAIDAAIKIGAIAILLIWCFSILRPFLMLVIWGGIIATALYPLVISLHNKTGWSESKTSWLLTLVGVLLLLFPLIALSTGIYTNASDVVTGIQDGSFVIPRPPEGMRDWPVVGDKLYAFINLASTNLEALFAKYGDQIRDLMGTIAGVVGSIGGGFVQFIVSTIIAGVFMSNAQKCELAFVRIAERLAGEHGKDLVSLSKSTVRSVVLGVIGVAVIQSILSGIGMAFVGVPALGIWMLAVLLIAIMQLPPVIALLPVIIYVFSTSSSTVAVIFLVWCLLVSGSDGVLKPMLLSRGSDIPMLVLLLGALGGMAMSGLVGLFVGAVILGLTYQLFTVWLGMNEGADAQEEDHKAG